MVDDFLLVEITDIIEEKLGVQYPCIQIRIGNSFSRKVDAKLFRGASFLKNHFESLKSFKETFSEFELKMARKEAYRKLALRDLHPAALVEFLEKRLFSASIIQEVVHELESKKYLDEVNWVQRAVDRCLQKGYSKRKIAAYLHQKGTDRSLIQKALNALGSETEESILQQLVEKRFSRWDLTNQGMFRRAFAFILRKGFTVEQARVVLTKNKNRFKSLHGQDAE